MYLTDSEGNKLNSETFSIDKYIQDIPVKMLSSTKGREALTNMDPLLFALLYIPHVLRSEETKNVLSVSDVNLELFRDGLSWSLKADDPLRPGLRQDILAPREYGKTTTVKCLILWAMAHEHKKYILLFGGNDSLALAAFKDIRREIDGNDLLRQDFPHLCTPAKWNDKAASEADTYNIYMSQSRCTLVAKSVWSGVLGAKINDKRPDLMIIDDWSKGEGAGGSTNDAAKQLEVLLGTILPLNGFAPVWMIGTNHYIGSLEDQARRSTEGEEFDWIKEERFVVKYIKPLVAREDGTLRSIHPALWSVDKLEEVLQTRSASKNFLNIPLPAFAGMGFEAKHFRLWSHVGQGMKFVGSRTVLSVDPGVSAKGDATGLAVIVFSQSLRLAMIREVRAVHLKAQDLKRVIMQIIGEYQVDELTWESNQGGEALAEATLGADFPLRITLNHTKLDKLTRAEMLLNRYTKNQIVHEKAFPAYEAEAKTFPKFQKSPNMVDAVAHGIEHLARNNINGPDVQIGELRR